MYTSSKNRRIRRRASAKSAYSVNDTSFSLNEASFPSTGRVRCRARRRGSYPRVVSSDREFRQGFASSAPFHFERPQAAKPIEFVRVGPDDPSAILGSKLSCVQPAGPTPPMHDDRLESQMLRKRSEPPLVRSRQVARIPYARWNARLPEPCQQLTDESTRVLRTASHLVSFGIEYLRDGIRDSSFAAEFQGAFAEFRESAERFIGPVAGSAEPPAGGTAPTLRPHAGGPTGEPRRSGGGIA